MVQNAWWVVGVITQAGRTTSQKNLHILLALPLIPGACKLPVEKGPISRLWNFSLEYSLPWLPREFSLTGSKAEVEN